MTRVKEILLEYTNMKEIVSQEKFVVDDLNLLYERGKLRDLFFSAVDMLSTKPIKYSWEKEYRMVLKNNLSKEPVYKVGTLKPRKILVRKNFCKKHKEKIINHCKK